MNLELIYFGSRPLAALLCVIFAWRGRYPVLGPALTGVVLGTGAVPLVWWLCRDRCDDVVEDDGVGLNPASGTSEPARHWRTVYLQLRHGLLLSLVLLAAIGPLALLMGLSFFLPTIVTFHGNGVDLPPAMHFVIWLMEFSYSPVGMALWVIWQFVWPLGLARILTSSYRVPIIGKVWSETDAIWLTHPPEQAPAEVRLRVTGAISATSSGPDVEALNRALKPLNRLTRAAWFLILLGFVFWLVNLVRGLYFMYGS